MKKLFENWRKYMIVESTPMTKYRRLMGMFQGDVENVDQVVMMTPENPHARAASDEVNAKRTELFREDMKAAGYGYRPVEGMYGGPEDSYAIPHMSREDAARYSYKYGQESFVYSIRQEGADAKMIHEMVMVDYAGAQQDDRYPLEEFGEIYAMPQSVNTTIDAETTEMLNSEDLASAEDYYSNIPGAPEKGRMSMDFYGGKPVDKGQQVDDPANPRYVREGTYIVIRESDVPRTTEAQKLAKKIKERCNKINENNRLGSSKYHHRKMMLSEKQQLLNIIKKMEEQ